MTTQAAPAAEADMPFDIGVRELVTMLALTQALQALAVDMMLPGLGEIARDLGASDPNRRQLVVGMFLIGIGIGSLVPGTLADRFGRRRVLLVCVSGYVAISFACALVTDFNVMVVLRLLEGLLCAGLQVVPLAIIRDRFEGNRMASLQSMMTVIFLVVPMLAPSLGQVVLLISGWRWVFGLMGAMGAGMGLWILLRLPESLRSHHRQSLHVKTIGRNIYNVLRTREAIGYVLANSCTLAVIWAYVQSCQQLVAEYFAAGKAFPLIFGGMSVVIAGSSFVNARIVHRFGARRVSHNALIVYIATSALQLSLAASGHERLWQFIILMTIMLISGGSLISANFSSIALQPFASTAGSASSVQAFIRNTIASLAGAAIAQAYDGTAVPQSIAMLGAGVLALSLVFWSEKGRLFGHRPAPA